MKNLKGLFYGCNSLNLVVRNDDFKRLIDDLGYMMNRS